jgi:hypothetical protein
MRGVAVGSRYNADIVGAGEGIHHCGHHDGRQLQNCPR